MSKIAPYGDKGTQAALKTMNMMKAKLSQLTHEYEMAQARERNLFRVLLCILDVCEDKELIIHRDEFIKLENEWRIEQWFDNKTQEFHLKLRTLKD
jgi:hypothetical protein